MFDEELEAALGDTQALADLAANVEHHARVAGCYKLVVAAAWADAHSGVDHPDGGLLVERLVRIGPAGTPLVAEFAPQGLVLPFGTSTASARSWLADALTIRHRLPRLWDRVVAGEVHHWKARQIATLTAHLSVAVAGQVDEQTSPWVGQLPWQTFLKTLDATMLQTDESTYRERERLAAAKREVRATPSEDGLRTLIARGEAGDVTLLLALYQRVAECLADDGDEDPLPVRMSKAIGIIANPARLVDLLARHASDQDPHRTPWEQEAAHAADPTDPWADDLPPAGWETAEHGNYRQPRLDEDERWDQPRPDETVWGDWPADPPVDDADLDWYHHQTTTADDHGQSDDTSRAGDAADAESDADADDRSGRADPPASTERQPAPCSCGAGEQVPVRWPDAFRRPGWTPLTPTQLAACAPTVVIQVHLSEQTLRDNHGVVRTETGPILLEQLKRFLVQHDAQIKVYPVVDPTATASADAYEAPLRLRRAMAIRHPRSVFPHSPCTSRLDLDHTPAYTKNGPPGQTGMHTLGPLARSEHRPKTVGQWRSKQPEPGTYLWRSPDGWIAVTTNQGTLVLGHTTWATHLWDSAA